MPTILIRVDSSFTIGSGHVYRCLALATELTRHQRVVIFACKPFNGHFMDVIKQHGFSVWEMTLPSSHDTSIADYDDWLQGTQQDDATQFLAIIHQLSNKGHDIEWIVVDHYGLDHRWESQVATHKRQLLVIDDLVNRNHHSALLLDQTFMRTASDYRHLTDENCQILAGLDYCLLRDEFSSPKQHRQEVKNTITLGVYMGASDVANVTKTVFQRLLDYTEAEFSISIVVGANYQYLGELVAIQEKTERQVEISRAPVDMVSFNLKCDLVFGAGGTSTWERCALATPSVLVCLADNQQHIVSIMSQQQFSYKLDDIHDHQEFQSLISSIDWKNLADLGARCQKLVDGMGCQRVVQAMLGLFV